jgi:pSer/pThr/pTyr-binding forkhead associated (FHA) protein
MSQNKDDDLPDFSENVDPSQRTMAAEDLRLGTRFGQRPWLFVVGGKRAIGTLIEIRSKMTIGRAPPVDIVLDEEGVSRRHAIIESVNGVIRVSDLDSSNGIRVNGRRVKVHALRDGERLRLGDAVLTLVHVDDNIPFFEQNLRASLDRLKKP